MTTSPNRIALAYSGGLDTSVIIPWLLENHPGCEVLAVVGDVGQDRAELVGIEEKALASGATVCEIADLREQFLEEFAFPMAISGAVYEGRYLLGRHLPPGGCLIDLQNIHCVRAVVVLRDREGSVLV